MKVHEYQAKEIFARYNIAVPKGRVAASAQEARQATQELGGRAIVKAQVHAGGRGRAGGISVVDSPEQAEQVAGQLLGNNLVTHQTGARGVPVGRVLVEELADIQRELYLAITIDRVSRGPVMLVSASGGMDIEEVAASRPQDIHSEPVDMAVGFLPFQARRLAAKLELEPSLYHSAGQVMDAIYRMFLDLDCSLVEINPLIVTNQGQLVALDAKLNLDDASMFRHQDLQDLRDQTQEDEFEVRAAELDIAYVNLGGDVGCLVNGAGLAMATLDVATVAGASPANFLDVGGGASDEKVASAMEIILSDPKVRRVLVNIFGGILRCDIAARGVVQAYRNKGSSLPMVVRMMGTNVEEGKAILRDSGLPVTFAETLSQVAEGIQHAG